MPRSIESSRPSCRCSSDWLRLARLRKTPLLAERSPASPTAASTAVRCTAENASAISVTSLVLARSASGGASAAMSTRSPFRSRLTTSGSRSSASVRTATRKLVSSRVMRRPNRTSSSPETITAASPAPPTRISWSRMTSPRWAAPLVSPARPMFETWVSAPRNEVTPDCQVAGATGIRAPGVVSMIRFSIVAKSVYVAEANRCVYGLVVPGQFTGESVSCSRSRWS